MSSSFYLLLLVAPLFWALHWRSISTALPAIPALVLNLLSQDDVQRDLIHQYSVPILPFLILVAIQALRHNRALFKTARPIVLWSLIGFISLAKPGYFWTRYLSQWETWQASTAQQKYTTPFRGQPTHP